MNKIMQLELNFEEILAHWVELKKLEGINLISVRRDENTLELFDGDGSDYFYEFEDWLQQQVSAAIKDDCAATDWHALAESICLAVTGSYSPREKGKRVDPVFQEFTAADFVEPPAESGEQKSQRAVLLMEIKAEQYRLGIDDSALEFLTHQQTGVTRLTYGIPIFNVMLFRDYLRRLESRQLPATGTH